MSLDRALLLSIKPKGQKPKPKRIPLITMTLKGIPSNHLNLEKVYATVYFNETANLFGLRLTLIHTNQKGMKHWTDLGIKDPYRHLEHLIGSALTNLRREYGGYIKLERYSEHTKVKGFSRDFFNKMELAEVSPV